MNPIVFTTGTVDKSGERVKRMFGEIAPRYDLMNHVLSLNVDRYWRWRTVRLVNPRGPEPILDLCTGTGDLAFAFSRFTGGRVKVVGADFCPEMLEIARQKQVRSRLTGEVEFLEADAQELPFPDAQFQAVSVAFGLRNVADTDRGLREMVRVLRPGGRLAVLEFSMPTWQPFKGIYSWYFRRVLPRIGQLFARNTSQAYEYLPQSVGEFPQGQALADRILAAGCEKVNFYPLTFGIATLYIGVK
jgi:demethylmenaquinone methyltransferase / 2-methoxy-6-polyprenyl-1,4-benzoquinol methylase